MTVMAVMMGIVFVHLLTSIGLVLALIWLSREVRRLQRSQTQLGGSEQIAPNILP